MSVSLWDLVNLEIKEMGKKTTTTEIEITNTIRFLTKKQGREQTLALIFYHCYPEAFKVFTKAQITACPQSLQRMRNLGN